MPDTGITHNATEVGRSLAGLCAIEDFRRSFISMEDINNYCNYCKKKWRGAH